jgi:hypothetical protein
MVKKAIVVLVAALVVAQAARADDPGLFSVRLSTLERRAQLNEIEIDRLRQRMEFAERDNERLQNLVSCLSLVKDANGIARCELQHSRSRLRTEEGKKQ